MFVNPDCKYAALHPIILKSDLGSWLKVIHTSSCHKICYSCPWSIIAILYEQLTTMTSTYLVNNNMTYHIAWKISYTMIKGLQDTRNEGSRVYRYQRTKLTLWIAWKIVLARTTQAHSKHVAKWYTGGISRKGNDALRKQLTDMYHIKMMLHKYMYIYIYDSEIYDRVSNM